MPIGFAWQSSDQFPMGYLPDQYSLLTACLFWLYLHTNFSSSRKTILWIPPRTGNLNSLCRTFSAFVILQVSNNWAAEILSHSHLIHPLPLLKTLSLQLNHTHLSPFFWVDPKFLLLRMWTNIADSCNFLLSNMSDWRKTLCMVPDLLNWNNWLLAMFLDFWERAQSQSSLTQWKQAL